MISNPLLEAANLRKSFPMRSGVFSKTTGYVRAVEGVSFSIMPGETFGLVGESGCGKSTTGRLVLRLIEPTGGSVKFEGEDLYALPKEKLRAMRRKMQIIFQDPYASLNPRMTVGATLMEPFRVHDVGAKAERKDLAAGLLEKVGLSKDALRKYPHEFSGGQRQRIGIARAIALNPRFIMCDEPVSALDVSVQAQVLNLLMDLKARLDMAYLFVSHDLSVVERVCDRVAVMYLGKIMEMGPVSAVYSKHTHPYTEALLSALPTPDPEKKMARIRLSGEPPSAINPPAGCVFHTRCPLKKKECESVVPPLTERAPGHWAACIVR
ncbi:MAG: ATP-binding cassette domain-containing protein [Nitrospinae bacterium]|nr:ATP-binding cassette domain-containing protein [Nitrospinota bacterium]